MTEVGSVSTTTVAPASSKQSIKRIEFTPVYSDWSNPKGVFSFPSLHPNRNTLVSWISELKTSLSRTLDFFYPPAGRLGTTVNEDKPFVYIGRVYSQVKMCF